FASTTLFRSFPPEIEFDLGELFPHLLSPFVVGAPRAQHRRCRGLRGSERVVGVGLDEEGRVRVLLLLLLRTSRRTAHGAHTHRADRRCGRRSRTDHTTGGGPGTLALHRCRVSRRGRSATRLVRRGDRRRRAGRHGPGGLEWLGVLLHPAALTRHGFETGVTQCTTRGRRAERLSDTPSSAAATGGGDSASTRPGAHAGGPGTVGAATREGVDPTGRHTGRGAGTTGRERARVDTGDGDGADGAERPHFPG